MENKITHESFDNIKVKMSLSDDEEEDKEKDEEMGDAVQVAAVSGEYHADIIGHRDTCGGCGAKMMHVGQRWCHDCGARLV